MEANDNAALRDALDDAVGLLEGILDAFEHGTGGVYKSDVSEAIDNARAALAKPPRNCDVGTVEEQQGRFLKFCDSHPRGNCFGCPALKMRAHCELAWAQMPYEADEKGEVDDTNG